jgi:hypothetical protein
VAQVDCFDGDADLLGPFHQFLFKIMSLDPDSFPFSTRMITSLIDFTRSISFIPDFISTNIICFSLPARGQSWFGSADIVQSYRSSGWLDPLASRSLHFSLPSRSKKSPSLNFLTAALSRLY